MEKSQILETLTNIFKDVLDDENIHLTPETTAGDVEEWDSLNHIQLVVAIERRFKIKFNSQEVHSWQNVGQLVESLSAKLN